MFQSRFDDDFDLAPQLFVAFPDDHAVFGIRDHFVGVTADVQQRDMGFGERRQVVDLVPVQLFQVQDHAAFCSCQGVANPLAELPGFGRGKSAFELQANLLARLLQLNYVRFTGGVLVVWIAIKLFSDAHENQEASTRAHGLWQAVWFILVADITMSIDNILAVAAASKGSLALLIFGLGLSIPFVVFTSHLLSRIMDRYPIVVYAGAAILGRVGGDMMVEDPWIAGLLHPSQAIQIGVQIFFAVAVVGAGVLVNQHLKRPAQSANQ